MLFDRGHDIQHQLGADAVAQDHLDAVTVGFRQPTSSSSSSDPIYGWSDRSTQAKVIFVNQVVRGRLEVIAAQKNYDPQQLARVPVHRVHGGDDDFPRVCALDATLARDPGQPSTLSSPEASAPTWRAKARRGLVPLADPEAEEYNQRALSVER